TRQIVDPEWPEFAAPLDAYPGHDNVRIVRLPFGGGRFLLKEELWPYLATEFAPHIVAFYRREGRFPDVITAHYADGGLAAAVLQEETGLPFTFTPHSLGAQKMEKLGAMWDNLDELDARFHFARRITAERIAMSQASVCTASTAQERFEQYAHPAYQGAIDVHDDRRLVVIPPGVNLRLFDKEARSASEEATRAQVRAKLARDIALERLDLPVIVASSRLDVKKNHIGLVRAFAESPQLREKANLLLITRGLDNPLADYSAAGDGAREVLNRIMAVVDKSGLRGKISLFSLDSQAELAAAYRFLAESRSVFALTTYYEPFGLAPLEAIAAGLPAVVTKNGGPAESLREGDEEYGVLVDPFDPADIARGLLRLLDDAATWQRYAEAGRRRVHDRYTWGNTARRFEQILARLDGQRKASTEPDRALQPAIRNSLSAPLPIHPYFLQPTPENDIPLKELAELYFKGEPCPLKLSPG
ncbi:MAG TPA: glycosyltransferase family 1 protein, partial [Anaerolineae bacterium]|nr:glycosyltransferase family 1 protein [Anaerolineae bacterium]